MTPKFDNLASLLMEMPKGTLLTDDQKLKIAMYVEDHPELTYEDIAKHFGIQHKTVGRIAREFDLGRGSESEMTRHKNKETHVNRRLSNAQEKQVLYYWLANHHEMTFVELGRWTDQKFNIRMSPTGLHWLLRRAAAKYGERLPPGDKGKGTRLKKQRSQHRNEPGSGKLPTQGRHHFDPGNTMDPPKPPGE